MAVFVERIPPGMTCERLKLYLGNPRRGGKLEVKQFDEDHRTAVLSFHNQSDAEKVVNTREFQFKIDQVLQVSWYKSEPESVPQHTRTAPEAHNLLRRSASPVAMHSDPSSPLEEEHPVKSNANGGNHYETRNSAPISDKDQPVEYKPQQPVRPSRPQSKVIAPEGLDNVVGNMGKKRPSRKVKETEEVIEQEEASDEEDQDEIPSPKTPVNPLKSASLMDEMKDKLKSRQSTSYT